MAALVLVGCTGSEDTLRRADFVDDPIFSIQLGGAEPEPLLAGPIGSRVTNDRGYRVERVWGAVDDARYRGLIADLVAVDVVFHRAACRASTTTLTGTKTLGVGVVVTVTAVRDHAAGSASVRVTGLEPDQEGATGLRPPRSLDIDDACAPGLLDAAGLA